MELGAADLWRICVEKHVFHSEQIIRGVDLTCNCPWWCNNSLKEALTTFYMKLLNLGELKSQFVETIKRFPLPFLMALAAAGLLIYQNHNQYADNYMNIERYVMPVVFTCIFGYLLFLAADLYASSHKKSIVRNLLRIVAAGLMVLLYLTFFRDFSAWAQTDFIKFAIINLAGVMLVLVAPFLKEKVKMQDFWNYLVRTFFSFVFTFVLFGILFAGVALLFTSIDFLFKTSIDGMYYFDAFLLITSVLASQFFLAGFPKDFRKVPAEGNFLRILSEYFLVPLVIIYFLMLYVYTGKIVATWQWPEGEVAGWIIGFSMVGIVAYIFSYTVKEKSLKFVEHFKNWFFVALIPLTFVLFVSLYLRIQAYGMTEWRYLGLAFGVWLLVNAIYFVFAKARDLRVFPVTLIAVMMVSIYGGPFSAFSISREDQIQRLVTELSAAGMIESDNVTLKKVEDFDYNSEAVAEVYDISQYLIMNHGFAVMQKRFDGEIDTLTVNDSDYWQNMMYFKRSLGFPEDYYPVNYMMYPDGRSEVYLNFTSDGGCELPPVTDLNDGSYTYSVCAKNVKGYDHLGEFTGQLYKGGAYQIIVDDTKFVLSLKDNYLVVTESGATNAVGVAVVNLDLQEFVQNLSNEFKGTSSAPIVPQARMNVEFTTGKYKGLLQLTGIMAIYKDEKFLNVDTVNGHILLKKR